MKIVEYNFDDVQNIVKLLNSITVRGVDSCASITQIATLLETGQIKNIVKKEENQNGIRQRKQ